MTRRVVIAPDKFKGSLSSFGVCDAIADGIKSVDADAEIFSFPMADGGDGFADVMKFYLQTETVDCETVDPLGRSIRATYQWNSNTKTAIIEMAVASGLVLLRPEERTALKTSTYGTGLLIQNAINKGVKKIILGLGGSATNDAGIGILAALGFEFNDETGKLLKPCGENLLRINTIALPPRIPSVEFEIACDVQNVLFGPNGAAYVYGPQKGADHAAVLLLDNGLKHFSKILRRQTGKDISEIPGTGAAGGIAAGLMSFFDVELKKGIDLVIESSAIKKTIGSATIVITGEGKIDQQTLEGKVVSEVAALAFANKIPVAAFCGILEANDAQLELLHVKYAHSLTDSSRSSQEAMNAAAEILKKKAATFFKNFIGAS